MMKFRLFALFLGLSLGPGCGGSGTGSVDSTATGADFCRSMVDAFVASAARCPADLSPYWRDYFTGSVLCDQVDGMLAAGTLTYDRASGEDCLTHLRQLDCVDIGLPESCTDAIAGRLPAGSQCSYFEIAPFADCAPGNYCTYTGNACGGICQPYVQPGGSCAYTDASGFPRCTSGSSCRLESESCVPYVSEGQPCQGQNSGDCGDGLYCDWGTTGSGICHKRRTSGTCVDGPECAAGYVCAGPADAKTCTKAKLPGDSCTQGQAECYGLSFCGDNGKCTRTGVAENQPCGTNLQGEYIQCGTDLYCAGTATMGDNIVAGVCQKRKPAGSPCSGINPGECAGNFAYCDSTTSLCVTCN